MIGSVAAPGNDLAFAELVGLANGITAILAADAEEVGRGKAPMAVFRANLGRCLAVGQVGHGHLGGFGVNCVWVNANHGADGTNSK